MRISIIIPSYNRSLVLVATLQRLARYQSQIHELIVVEQSAENDPRLEDIMKIWGKQGTLMRQAKPNAQAARNYAAKKARSPILLFLDDDIDPEPGLIRTHLENYNDSSIHAVAGYYLEPGEHETSKSRQVIWWRPLTKIEQIPANFSKRADSALWPSCNGSIRKQVFTAIGGFDENFRYTLLDDTDLSVRMFKAGYRCVHDPAARLMHLKEPTGGNRPVKPEDKVIAPSARWCNWTYFFLINWGILGLGELAYRWRTHVFRRPYLIRPRLFLKASYAFVSGVIEGLVLLLKGRRLGKFD